VPIINLVEYLMCVIVLDRLYLFMSRAQTFLRISLNLVKSNYSTVIY
jgi:hypothetical protein